MKKFFALLLLPSIAFAGKIGENYVGIGTFNNTNSADIRTSPSVGSWDAEWDGWGFTLGGNLNLKSLDSSSWGADIYFVYTQIDLEPNSEAVDYLTDAGSSSPNDDLESSSFGINLRPYTKLGDGLIFASLGFGRSESDDVKESGLSLGAGYELTLDKISLRPQITHVSLDEPIGDQTSFGLIANYELSDKINLILAYRHTKAEDINLEVSGVDVKIDQSANTFDIGISYEF